jgi:hypothetical protein
MRTRAALRAAILATALTLGFSCKTPLVEGPASLKMRQHHAQKPHPCATNVIEGGLNTSCHILFQLHRRPFTQATSKKVVRSQILLYNVVSDLIKNYGVSVVLLEATDISEDMKQTLSSKCDRKCSTTIQAALRSCVADVIYDAELQKQFFDSQSDSKRKAEDYCLAKVLWHSYSLAHMAKALLVLNNTSVIFTGFERDRKKRFRKLKKQRFLWKLRKVIGPLFAPHFETAIVSSYGKLEETRSKYVDKDAIMEAISHSFQNTALIIGLGHRERIEEAIRAIPFDERPTFYFIMPECPGERDFFISSYLLDLAAKASVIHRNKQNL